MYTSDVEDVERMLITYDIKDVLAVVFLKPRLENTPGSNGIPRWKK
jgi:hypothetical protein